MSLFRVVCVLGLAVAASLAQHTHEEHEDAFSHVLDFFGATNEELSNQQTNLLIRHMLYRVGCSVGVNCRTCLATDTVLQYLNRTAENSLHEEAFHKLSVILAVFLRDTDNECANSEATLGPGGRSYPEFIELFVEDAHHPGEGGAHGDHMDLHKLEDLLLEINERHNPGHLEVADNGDLISGPTLNLTSPSPCISPMSLFEELGVDENSDIEGEGLEDLAALLVTRILQGYCLSPEGLPPPHNFVADIFMNYADKSTGLIDHEGFEKILTTVGVGGEHQNGEDDHGHEHSAARKRRAVDITEWRRTKRAAEEEGHDHSESYDVSGNCYSGEQLLKVFLENSSTSISPSLFETICPSIVQQLLSGVCTKKTTEKTKKTSTTAEAYGYGSIAIFIITLCTLLGAALATIKSADVKRRLMAFMISIAIGTLLGDPALHLIPEATGIHDHEHDEEFDINKLEIEPYIWKMMALLASFYAFFLLELFMNRSSVSHSHSHDVVAPMKDSVSPTKGHVEEQPEEDEKRQSNKALIVMICVGDALHNFADGMAVGAAFALSVPGGISTSIAILCHELPHELGDFAALLSAGLSIKKAMLMNFLSGCSAFLGLYVGINIGENEEGRAWIFVVAAGMFIYVALANLVPEIMNMFRKAKDTAIIFICVNIGILIGFAIMFVIAVFERFIRI